MKKVISAVLLGFSTFAMAQVSFAGKVNLLLPASNSFSWKELRNSAQQVYQDKGKSSAGFNAGISAKIDLPISIYLMPELYYTHYKNEVKEQSTQTVLKAKTSRIDLPVLVGYRVLGNMASVFVGPVASYNLSKNETYGSFKENVAKDFTVGYQLGAQVEISDFIVNARYEGAFSKDQRKFINSINGSNYEIRYDNRPNFFLLGLGYKF